MRMVAFACFPCPSLQLFKRCVYGNQACDSVVQSFLILRIFMQSIDYCGIHSLSPRRLVFGWSRCQLMLTVVAQCRLPSAVVFVGNKTTANDAHDPTITPSSKTSGRASGFLGARTL